MQGIHHFNVSGLLHLGARGEFGGGKFEETTTAYSVLTVPHAKDLYWLRQLSTRSLGFVVCYHWNSFFKSFHKYFALAGCKTTVCSLNSAFTALKMANGTSAVYAYRRYRIKIQKISHKIVGK